MSELIQMHESFYSNIFKSDNDLSFIKSNFPQERFNIYKNNIFENMKNALRITYPGIWKLLGKECANQVAYRYCKESKNLSKTGCLDYFGGDFYNFLSQIKELSSIPYLKDYGYYEWLKHLSYMSEDIKPIIPSDLLTVPENMLDHAKFSFCPDVFILQSKYPISDISNVVDNRISSNIKLKKESSYMVISRKNGEINTYYISKENWLFIKNLIDGKTISQSSDYASSVSDNFELSYVIAFILQAGLVNKVLIDEVQ